MKRNNANIIDRFRFVVLLVLIMTLFCACSDASAGDIEKINGEELETQPPVQVTMPEYEFTYSGTLADVIAINELEDTNNLEFTVKIGEEEFTIFVMHFNAENGDLVEFLIDSKGNKIPVSFEMMPLPEKLRDDDALQFYHAQESVNDIVESIKLK